LIRILESPAEAPDARLRPKRKIRKMRRLLIFSPCFLAYSAS
jgi:hypothetical protein